MSKGYNIYDVHKYNSNGVTKWVVDGEYGFNTFSVEEFPYECMVRRAYSDGARLSDMPECNGCVGMKRCTKGVTA